MKAFVGGDHFGEGDEGGAFDVALLVAVDAQGGLVEVVAVEAGRALLLGVAAVLGVALSVPEVRLVLAASYLLCLTVQDQLVAFVCLYALDEVPLF